MNALTRALRNLIVLSACVSVLLMSTQLNTRADQLEPEAKTFLIYQLQTASLLSASSEFISIINTSTKPQRLDGLCLHYSAATSDSWIERACFTDTDVYAQSWLVAGGTAYISSDTFLAENPTFVRDLSMSGAMAGSGGAVKLTQHGNDLDMVGWGNSNLFETQSILAPSNDEIAERVVIGSDVQDSDDNSLDFVLSSQGIIAISGVFEVEVPRDMCNNIEGLQEVVPIGLTQEDEGCYQDMCLNIEGLQKTATGFSISESGECRAMIIEDSTLVITELLPNTTGVDDGKEFIELHNPNNMSVNLRGYMIIAGSKTFVLGDFELASTKYISFTDSETDITLPNTTGVEVVVVAPSGREVSRSVIYANAPEDQSWILINGQWQFSNQPTPGSANKISIQPSIGGEPNDDELAPCPEGKFRNPLTNRCKQIESVSALVPCDADEFRNPTTNRCNKFGSSSSSLKPCAANQERNPLTNRCRSITTASALKPCPEGKERNPKTNRCRNVAVLAATDGSSEQALTAQIVDVPAPGTGVNWAIIITAVLGSLGYIVYEWRVELTRTVATIRSYRYN